MKTCSIARCSPCCQPSPLPRRQAASPVSSWEIVVKHRMGRLPLPEPPDQLIPTERRLRGIAALAFDEDSALQGLRLPPLHRDPFDRLLAAHARPGHSTGASSVGTTAIIAPSSGGPSSSMVKSAFFHAEYEKALKTVDDPIIHYNIALAYSKIFKPGVEDNASTPEDESQILLDLAQAFLGGDEAAVGPGRPDPALHRGARGRRIGAAETPLRA